MIGDYLEINTYEYLLAQALSKVSDSYDKRQGSIMWDTLAPHDYQLAEFYLQLREIYKNTFADSAEGEYLDLKVAEQGMTRFPATYAIKKAQFTDVEGQPMNIPLGTRFTTVSTANPINYVVLANYMEDGIAVPGTYQMKCETLGTVGNDYIGELLNITYISGIATATMSSLLVPARDLETDEQLRTRYFIRLSQKPFGGNIAQYDEEVKSIEGVGELQIYPVWNGGGTVKLSVIDTEYNPLSSEFIQSLQQTIDPENAEGVTGTGLGLAPIGHKVTVVTPQKLSINVSAKLTLNSGYSLSQMQEPVKQALERYMLQLRQQWGVGDELNNYSLGVFLAQITLNILSVPGVANVTNITINGSAKDLLLTQTATLQQLPVLGTVSLT